MLKRRLFVKLSAFAIGSGALVNTPVSMSESNPMVDKPQPPGSDPSRAQMIKNLLRANAVAAKAREHGSHPFGAILVGADHETVLMEQGNIDTVNHAESTLARLAAERFSPDELWACTLYTTAEPCAMCAGTQYWANIGRLVYAMSESTLLSLTGNHDENPTMDVPSRYVFTHSQKAIRVWGPIAEVEADIAALHKDFWG